MRYSGLSLRGARTVQGLLNVINTNQTLAGLTNPLGWNCNPGSVCDGPTDLRVDLAKVGKHETALGQAGMRPEISRGFLAVQ